MSIPTTKRPVRILHLEDNVLDHEIVQEVLESDGINCEIHRVQNREDFEAALSARPIDLIVSDHALPAFDGSSALEMVRERLPGTPFIFVTGSLGEESAVEKIRNGATDYILKHRLDRLAPAVRRALEEAAERTRREQAEEELQRSNLLFRQISENVHDLIAILDLDGRRLYNSASYRNLLGDPELLRGTESLANVHPDDQPRMRELFRRTVATGIGQRAEYRLVTPDGEIRHVESQGSVIRDREGKVINVLVVSRDITERKAMEAAVLAAEAKFRCLVEQSLVGIYVIREGRFVYVNPKMTEIFGLTEAELTSTPLEQLVFADDWPLAKENIGRRLRGEIESVHYTLRMLRKNGAIIHVEAHGGRADFDGQPAIIGALLDVSEKKLIQEQLLRTQRMETVGALASGVAHDLNNVLAPILMVTDMLLDEVHSASSKDMLETLRTSAQRGSGLVRQILSFARGTGSEFTLVQTRHLVMEMAKLARDTFARSIDIQTNAATGLLPIEGNATQIHQVLLNLCVNARDAMPQGGTLRLVARNAVLDQKRFVLEEAPVSGTFVQLVVTDTGSGIPAPLLGRIFEPFFTTKEAGKGTGIGLSTVLAIIKAHRGHIEVESAPGVGTSFNVYLPVATAALAQVMPSRAEPPPAGKGELILLVDDELALLGITREMLLSFNYRVVSASNGADALALFQRHRGEVRAVITDTMMPLINGAELVRLVRQLDARVKIIVVSGQSEDTSAFAGQRGEIFAFLAKPYTSETILQTLGEALKPSLA